MTDGNKADDKNSGLLMSVAETIGSTLGSLAAKAGAAQKSIEETTSEVVRKVAPTKRKASIYLCRSSARVYGNVSLSHCIEIVGVRRRNVRNAALASSSSPASAQLTM